jgi:hypothetical protein
MAIRNPAGTATISTARLISRLTGIPRRESRKVSSINL